MKKYVIYRRVSTAEQGRSGLGLNAQTRDVELFLANYSDTPYDVLGTFTDVLSGKSADRPELQKAIALAKKECAELLVAKLDRLSRKVSFIATIMEDPKLRLRVATMPHADIPKEMWPISCQGSNHWSLSSSKVKNDQALNRLLNYR